MKKDTFYLMIIVVLLLLNLGTLLFTLSRRPAGHPPGDMRFDRLVEKELNLDDNQRTVFEEIKRDHHAQMLSLDRDMKAPFEAYFSLIPNKTDAIRKDSLEKIISGIYQKKAAITFQHFQQLYALCNESQKQHFNNLVPHLLQVIGPPPISKGRPGPPEE